MNAIPQFDVDAAINRATAAIGSLGCDEAAMLPVFLNDVASEIPKVGSPGMDPPAVRYCVRSAFVRWLLLTDDLIAPQRQSLLRLRGLIVKDLLILNEAKIKLPVRLEHCQVLEGIDAYGLRVPRLTIWGGRYGPVKAIRAKVDGEIALTRGVRLDGKIDLRGANLDALIVLGASLAGTASHTYNRDDDPDDGPKAIDARNMELRFLQFDACSVTGRIVLAGAKVSGEMRVESTTIASPGNCALRLDGSRIDGRLTLSPKVVVEGGISIQDATIGLGLDACGLEAHGDLLLPGTRFGGALRLLGAKMGGTLDLERATASVLDDDEASWPATGKLKLAGFAYDALGTDAPSTEVARRLDWLSRRGSVFKPQPYDQLAAVFRKMGREADARSVIVARQRAMRDNDQTMSLFARGLNVFVDWTVRYGYSGFRPAMFLVVLFVLGGFVYRSAEIEQAVVHRPPDKGIAALDAPTIFSPWVYSFETLIPKPDLFEAHDWTLSDDRKFLPYWFYRWFHTIAGSITLILLALTPTRVLGRD